MRRAIRLLLVVAAVLAMAGGVVLAADKTCSGSDCVGTRGADRIIGSNNPNNIAGMEGNDIITAGVFHDDIYGDEGNDTITDNNAPSSDVDFIYGDEGNDTIDVQEGDDEHSDVVNCGPGTKDKVFFDEGFDTVTGCEKKTQGNRHERVAA